MSKWGTLKVRIITAVILFLLLAAATTQLPPFYFALFIALIVLRAGWEWTRFLSSSSNRGKLLYLGSLALMAAGIFGLLGITPAAAEIDELRATMILGLGQFFWLFSVVLLRGYPGNREDWNDDSHIAAMGLFALLPVLVALVCSSTCCPMARWYWRWSCWLRQSTWGLISPAFVSVNANWHLTSVPTNPGKECGEGWRCACSSPRP